MPKLHVITTPCCSALNSSKTDCVSRTPSLNCSCFGKVKYISPTRDEERILWHIGIACVISGDRNSSGVNGFFSVQRSCFQSCTLHSLAPTPYGLFHLLWCSLLYSFFRNKFAPAKLICRCCLVPILFAILDTSSGSSTQEPAPCLPEQSVNKSHLPLGMWSDWLLATAILIGL